ncbi:SusC/RagA family TonB-linked outer membrane protein [Sphingobacterium kitahiroshimense]|uniref:SusC/RagA family TonB-linked outer membrane protein n=1 Tax=Sphingobacterium sp. B16(2022) TaxID=2914044 RepID=UPI0014388E79|nr:SusC/RagA family TonB-linked outer membrane protein [Sphingobacterium sp. B16(2022)]NJI74956.1 SusC/RagA family TonB-linked outer membrane protein [Sphingobacterium sp. B16(2022)]
MNMHEHPQKKILYGILIFLFLLSSQLYAQQQKTVSGVVKDAKGEALADLSVSEKGMGNATKTDADGKFSIKLKSTKTTLVFSYVGFLKQEKELISGDNNLSVIMKEDGTGLDEVVIMGYQDIQRRKTTGAIATVKGKDFENTPYATFDGMLQGRVAGLTVLSTSGEPGTNNIVNIRGSSNLGLADNAMQAPLYVIDNIIYDVSDIQAAYGNSSPLQAINPNDIESVDVLKDASASSIYGARAANGVIIIKTKRPATGKPEIRISAYNGVSGRPSMKPITVGAAERRLKSALLYQSGNYNWFNNGTISQMLTDSLNPSFNNNTDWQGLFLQSANINNVNVSIGASMEKFLYRFSAQRYYEEGVMMGFENENLTPRLLLQVNPTDNFQFETNLFAGFTKAKHGSGDDSKYPFNTWGFPSSFYEITDVEKSIYTGRYDGLMDRDNSFNLNGNFAGTMKKFVFQGLTLRTQFSFNINNNTRDLFRPALITGNRNLAQNWVNQNKRWEWETYFNYIKSINNVHNISAVIGTGLERNTSNQSYLSGSSDNSDYIKTVNNIPSGSDLFGSASIEERSRVSFFGRFNYDFKDKYLLSASYRMDASSRYSKDNRWGIFPSISGGWVLSEEPFFQGLKGAISFLKFRGSYGLTGRDPGSVYARYTNLTFDSNYFGSVLDNGLSGSQFTYNGVNVAYPNYSNSAISATIKWERSPQFNIGLDMNLLRDRVTVQADFYVRDSKDLVYDLTMPVTSGYSTISNNFISVRNSGVELTLISRNMAPGSPFQWTTNFNLAYNKNVVTNLPDGGKEINVGQIFMQRALNVGQPIYPFKVWQVDGVFATDNDVPIDPLTGNKLFDAGRGQYYRAGDPRRKDVNGDFIIDHNDKVDMGNPNPDFTGGFINQFSYKNFSLSTLISFVFGRTLWNGYLSDRLQDAGSESLYNTWGTNSAIAGDFNIDDFWRPNAGQSKYPTLFRNSVDNWHISNDTFVENASFVRLKNIQLSYTLPQNLIKRLKLRMLRVYTVVDNIAVKSWSSVPDPEAVQPNGYSTGNGYPIPKKWTIGLDLTF